jgi:hypothetical protein
MLRVKKRCSTEETPREARLREPTAEVNLALAQVRGLCPFAVLNNGTYLNSASRESSPSFSSSISPDSEVTAPSCS